jgi:deazaflavin-dependent oxidoreductase (nitroreductase family)
MTKPFRMTFAMRYGTALLRFLLRAGVPIGPLKLLIHQGRKSGRVYTTPVALVERDGLRWLVAAFGEVNWVHNIRAEGRVELSSGRQTDIFAIRELEAAEAAPILKQFLRQYGLVPFIPPYFEATAQSPLVDFEQEALRHPVFRIVKHED